MSLTPREFASARAYLLSHSAEIIPHPGGSLLRHLDGTCNLLRAWDCPPEICLAGLCHTAYGTDGWPHTTENPDRRDNLARIIGRDAERLVHFYASCDRAWLYPQLAPGALVGIHDVQRAQQRLNAGAVPEHAAGPTTFRDRFSGKAFVPDAELYRMFLELTFANELEIIRVQWPHVCEQNRTQWQAIFEACRDLVSPAAYVCYRETFQLPRAA